jgi:hypothetical protein
MILITIILWKDPSLHYGRPADTSPPSPIRKAYHLVVSRLLRLFTLGIYQMDRPCHVLSYPHTSKLRTCYASYWMYEYGCIYDWLSGGKPVPTFRVLASSWPPTARVIRKLFVVNILWIFFAILFGIPINLPTRLAKFLILSEVWTFFRHIFLFSIS